jgi:hypothetical protein
MTIKKRGRKPIFNSQQVEEIKNEYYQGNSSMSKIAVQRKTSVTTIQKIIDGKYIPNASPVTGTEQLS